MKLNTANLSLIVTILSACLLTGCGWTSVGPGHVGIVVNMAGSSKGVTDTPVRTGWVFYNPITESVYEYPTSMQTAKWTASPNEGKPIDESITFTNKDSMVIGADISLSYFLHAEKVPYFYVKFLAHDEKEIDTKFTHGFLRNIARDCFNEHAGKYGIEQVMGDNAVFIEETKKCVQSQVLEYGAELTQFGFIGAPRPPQSVIDAINNKAQANQVAQKKQIELIQVQADAAKLVAQSEGEAKAQITKATGEAEANRIRNASITPNILNMRALDNQNAAIWRWDGRMPEYLSGGDKGGNFLIGIPNK